AAGTLHRDVKPPNVLVTPAGRVVLLDFGVVAELSARRSRGARRVVGTPAYMAPEVGSDTPQTEASDWYAVGVMLYEALTGVRPYDGSLEQMLADKRSHPPIPPAALNPAVPLDLDALCMELLQPDP